MLLQLTLSDSGQFARIKYIVTLFIWRYSRNIPVKGKKVKMASMPLSPPSAEATELFHSTFFLKKIPSVESCTDFLSLIYVKWPPKGV